MKTQILLIEPFEFEADLLQGELHISLLTLASFLLDKTTVPVDLGILDLKCESNRGNLAIPRDGQTGLNFEDDLYSLISKIFPNFGKQSIVGITCLTSKQYTSIVKTAQAIKSMFPGVQIVVGGYHPTFLPQDFQREHPFLKIPLFDYIILGEGEAAFSDIVKFSHKRISNRKSGQIIRSETIVNLNLIPELKFELYSKYIADYKSTSLCLSRGCPYNCRFCVENSFRKIRDIPQLIRVQKPEEAVIRFENMVNYVQDYGISKFGFFDPCFAYKKDWRRKFLDLLIQRDLIDEANELWAETRVDLLQPGDLTNFKKARLNLFFGLESGSPEMLRLMNKSLNPLRYLDLTTKLIRELSILELPCSLGIIHNFPGETAATFSETINYLKKIVSINPQTWVSPSLYQNFPGTHVFNNMVSYEKKYGTKFYFPQWWYDRTQNLRFSSSLIDASRQFPMSQIIETFFQEYPRLVKQVTQTLTKSGNSEVFGRGLALIKWFREEKQKLNQFIENEYDSYLIPA